jgi:hypothetical protein
MSETETSGVTRRTAVLIISTVLMGLLSSVWGLSQSFQTYRSEENQAVLEQHRVDPLKHISMERHVDLFVLRKEYEQDVRDIKTHLETINRKLDQIQERRP